MTGFKVDAAALLAVVDRMAEFDGRIEAHLARVTATVQRLSATWSGDADEAERSAEMRWQQGAQEMRDALDRLRAVAEGAHANYTGAAAQNTRMWG